MNTKSDRNTSFPRSIDDATPADWDAVFRPHHYNTGNLECIEAIQESMDKTEFKGYLKGNVMKYIWRYEYKNGVEDLRKARWYLERLIEEVAL
jgi:hypothetical protein